MLLTTLVCSKFSLPPQSIPLSVNRSPPPLAYDVIKFDNVHIQPKDCPFENTDQDSCSPFGEIRSASLEITSPNKTTPSMGDSTDQFYTAPPEEQGSSRPEKNENFDGINKGKSSTDSANSERYYTPEEDEQFFSETTVS